MKIGFIGLGRMGHHVAANLLKAGHQVTVWNRSQEPVRRWWPRARWPPRSPQDALQGEAVFSMLSNDAVMREVGLAGPLLAKAAKSLIHVNMATISVDFAQGTGGGAQKGGSCLHLRAGDGPPRHGGSGAAGADRRRRRARR